MSASADKVQYLLENLLEESLPLVKRGIFSQVELRQMMHRREKCEQAMLKKEYRLTDYLAAIEYEYELERERRSRMAELAKVEEGHINPAYKKESSSDFAIVKRILRLWDRTMHKYKFKLHLWKQYLQFCLAIGSRKHFYKALTNALRFLPFQLDLWRIAIAYEQEVGRNLWRGRKILIKGLKMIPSGPRNIELGEDMLRFELEFLNTIIQRREILVKGDTGMKLIGEEAVDSEEELEVADKEEQAVMDQINLQDYDKILWIVVEEIINKNRNDAVPAFSYATLQQRLLKTLNELLQKEGNHPDAQAVLGKVMQQLQQTLPKSEMKEENQILEFGREDEVKEVDEFGGEVKLEEGAPPSNDWLKLNDFLTRISTSPKCINWKQAELALKTFCLKPSFRHEIYSFLINSNPFETMLYLLRQKNTTKFPPPTIALLIKLQLDGTSQCIAADSTAAFTKLLCCQIDRWVEPADLRGNLDLLKVVLEFNAEESRYASTTRIIRSLSIAYKNEPEFLEFCNQLANSR